MGYIDAYLNKYGYSRGSLAPSPVKHVQPASEATMDKLNKLLSMLPKERVESLKRHYSVPERGYWGEWSANNCINKLGGI